MQATAYIHILTNGSEYLGNIPRVASVVSPVWYQSHTIISVSPDRVLQLYFKKLFCSEIKLAIIAVLESGQNTSGASSGAINFE